MAQQLYFSRDTRMFVQFRNTTDSTETAADLGKGVLWEIPVLDGYSFSQATNTSEIALSEMESSAGISRRGRRMFTDSLAPAEWSFSTYARPFKSLAGSAASGTQAADASAEVHAVEEVLWASMFGADKVLSNNFVRNVQPVGGADAAVLTAGSSSSILSIAESNRSAMHSFTLYFLIDTATANPLLYRMPEAIVNEASVDFDVDGIATINWSGFAKEIQDNSTKIAISATATPATNTGRIDGTDIVIGDFVVNTGNTRSVHIVNTATGGSNVVATQAIDEAITSTSNFIRNRLTGVSIEAADAADKVAGVFPGQYAVISAVNTTTDTVTTSTAHNFTAGDQVYITGVSGTTELNATHYYAGALASTTFKLYTTYAKAITGAATGSGTAPVVLANAWSSSTGTVANGKYSLTLTGGNFNLGNNITYLVPEELGAINKPLEHVTGTRTATGNATCYLTLEDSDSTNGTSRQFFNDLVGTGAMSKVVNKFKVTMDIGGTAAAADAVNPALSIVFPTAHIEVPSHSIEDVISLETNFTALPTDFGAADEITSITYVPPATY
jgi:hypothetical protein